MNDRNYTNEEKSKIKKIPNHVVTRWLGYYKMLIIYIDIYPYVFDYLKFCGNYKPNIYSDDTDNIIIERMKKMLKLFNDFQLVIMSNCCGSITKVITRIYNIKSELIEQRDTIFLGDSCVSNVLLSFINSLLMKFENNQYLDIYHNEKQYSFWKLMTS